MRSSFSASARGSSTTRSISAKTVGGLSDAGPGSGSTGRSLCSVFRERRVWFSISIPPCPTRLSIPSRFETAAPFLLVDSFLPVHSPPRRQAQCRVRFCGSRPRLFGEEANDISSDLIALTPLRQEDRVSRSAEKTGPHHWKNNLGQRRVDDVLVECVEPRLVQ